MENRIDVEFEFDEGTRCYVLRAKTEVGGKWFKRVYGIRSGIGKLIALPLFPEVYNSALLCQLRVTVNG